MLNVKAFKTEFKRHKPLETYAVSSSLFQRTRKLRNNNLFISAAVLNKNSVSDFNTTPDYTKLINDVYPKRIYTNFLNRIINTPNIILEEDNVSEVAREVKDNPWKRYSIPTEFHSEYSRDIIENYQIEFKDNNSVEFDTNFSIIIGNDAETTITKPGAKNKRPSFLTNDYIDTEFLTDEQLQRLIDMKMQKLNVFNAKLEYREIVLLHKKYGLSRKHMEAIRKFQLRIRAWILKKKFFKVVRMNEYLEHRINYLTLKKCMKRFDSKNNDGKYANYYNSVVDIFGEK